MSEIKGTCRNGRVVLNVPPEWPEGTKVLVKPIPHPPSGPDEEFPPSAEEIARRLTLMDQIQPLILTPEEAAAWRAARESRGELEEATSDERAENPRRIGE